MRRALTHRPDVLIVDVQMPPLNGDDKLRAALEMRRREASTGVLILSQFCEPAYVMEPIGDRPEGIGFLFKERVGDLDTFVDAINRVAAGGSALAAMAEGKSYLRVAQTLYSSHASVEKHVTAIFRKLRIAPAETDHGRVHAVPAYLRVDDQQP